jgi:hypothetical protein
MESVDLIDALFSRVPQNFPRVSIDFPFPITVEFIAPIFPVVIHFSLYKSALTHFLAISIQLKLVL